MSKVLRGVKYVDFHFLWEIEAFRSLPDEKGRGRVAPPLVVTS